MYKKSKIGNTNIINLNEEVIILTTTFTLALISLAFSAGAETVCRIIGI